MRHRQLALVSRHWSPGFSRLGLPARDRLKAVLQRRPRYLVALGLAVALGCADPGAPKGDLPALHPARGKVVRNGLPVGGGSVRFHPDPEDLNLVVGGEVRADGSFELQTQHAQSQKSGPGAPAGTYRVTYFPSQADQTAGPPPEPVTPSQPQTIQAGNNDLTVELGKGR